MKTTKELARELGIIRKRNISTSLAPDSSKKIKVCSAQIFSYLVVLDFESTCWQDGKFHTQEIIEFPAVLCNTKTGKIESEFHYYVQPQEQPVLSDFCKKLTGITQSQVEQGIPLSLCLRKFTHWLNKIKREKNIIFEEGLGARATFVTWSDWDLGVCLLYEARRKQLTRPPEMNSWIDLRATYRKFYGRKPHGLNGALQDVGIEFQGREHSGVDDARNTARLAWRMMRDGCIMNVTKNINMGTSDAGNLEVMETKGSRNILGKHGIEHFSDTGSGSLSDQVPHPNKVSKVLRQSKLHPVKGRGVTKENSLSPTDLSRTSVKRRGLYVRDCNKIALADLSSCSTEEETACLPSEENANTCHLWPDSKPKKISSKLNLLDSKSDSPKSSLTVNSQPSNVSRTPGPSNSTGNWRVFKTPNQCTYQNHTNNNMHDAGGGKCLLTPKPTHAKFVFKTPSPRQNGLTTSMSTSSSMRATPPMCKCGRRSKRRMVQSPGPNLGRFFFTCGVRTSQYDKVRGCDFFQWESLSAGGHNSSRQETMEMYPSLSLLS